MNVIPGLSVIVITYNEELDIDACLSSVKEISSDIIVVDSGSSDKTVSIAKRFTEHVHHRDWEGFGPQKAYALEKSRGPWVLNIDADERVSPELAAEINQTLNLPLSNLPHGFQIPFRHFFRGRQLCFGGSQGETHIRLFQKIHSSYARAQIHEGIAVSNPIGRMRGWIDHYSYRSVEDYLAKCNRYTTLIAQKKALEGKKFRPWHHLRLPWEFVIRYFFKLGFLDGSNGFLYAALSSYYAWLKFVKMKDFEGGATQ